MSQDTYIGFRHYSPANSTIKLSIKLTITKPNIAPQYCQWQRHGYLGVCHYDHGPVLNRPMTNPFQGQPKQAARLRRYVQK
jgi:hypothetical protein